MFNWKPFHLKVIEAAISFKSFFSVWVVGMDFFFTVPPSWPLPTGWWWCEASPERWRRPSSGWSRCRWPARPAAGCRCRKCRLWKKWIKNVKFNRIAQSMCEHYVMCVQVILLFLFNISSNRCQVCCLERYQAFISSKWDKNASDTCWRHLEFFFNRSRLQNNILPKSCKKLVALQMTICWSKVVWCQCIQIEIN